MSEINPVGTTGATGTASTTATTAAETEAAISATTIGEDFNTFLQLLTAQIQNQDPLAPMDSTQFVEQLATFSSLEQQVQTNSTLENIASMIGDLHSAAANEWLGQDVAVSSQYVAYEGKPVEFEVNPAYNYDQAVLTVTDSQNNIVWEEILNPDAERHTWNGDVLNQNTPANNGVYEFRVDLLTNGQSVVSTQAEIISKITTLANEDGQLMLGTDNYLTTDLDGVRKVETE